MKGENGVRRRKDRKERSLRVRRKVRPERVRRKGGGSLVRERVPERERERYIGDFCNTDFDARGSQISLFWRELALVDFMESRSINLSKR